MKAVKLLKTTEDGQVVAGHFFVGADGRVMFQRKDEDVPVPDEHFVRMFGGSIRAIDGSGELSREDGMSYLDALRYYYSGSYMRATAPLDDDRVEARG